ncbi:Holliday junction branch migration protein RuvA [Sedimentitalea sp. JM2-8]|uniref:Holliday junction branch migration complex subunit RuvA n=1 Tax=Sedimentitalea xiamensis TaxID=3050037 RepID=A0ABT7FEJ8_9RHOB|nr:Holliday junction branch migration protein RuvA [Sedimentitalea xiamensis]MDK3073244.1 Holliday junction branch migration protein RuvA [Sedimentitalea xiamensis]
MIGRLRGRLEYRGADHVLIDVQGVGYIVFCSDRTLAALPGPGEAVSLFTDMVVREDLMQLYGFLTLMEKEWHRLLCSVQGVGARVSLAILGALGPDGVGRAIALGDAASIKAAKGVGPKTAQRVVLDLKDKAPAVMAMGSLQPVPESTGTAAPAIEAAAPAPRKGAAAPVSDVAAQAAALSALSNLGYAPGDAAGAVAEASAGLPEAGEADLIRAALKLLAPKG